ncbi:Os01g0224166, partial [Oryza sativa Japonica Group]
VVYAHLLRSSPSSSLPLLSYFFLTGLGLWELSALASPFLFSGGTTRGSDSLKLQREVPRERRRRGVGGGTSGGGGRRSAAACSRQGNRRPTTLC